MMSLKTNKDNSPLKNKFYRGLWLLCWNIFGIHGPRFLSPIRILLLRTFGAKINSRVLICSGVKILLPYNLIVEDEVAISEDVTIYNFAMVVIGRNTVISRGVFLCTGSHDHEKRFFPLISKPINIGKHVWIAAESFILPGVVIGNSAVIGARSVVSKNILSKKIYAGNPARVIGTRKIHLP